MKKFLSTLFFTLVSFSVLAQKFEPFKIQTDGTLKIESTGVNYLVVEYPDMNAEELRSKVINNITMLYKDPKSVLSVSNNVVTVRGFAQDVTIYKDSMWGNKTWSINYSITFQFKDKKIRIEVPSVDIINQYGTRDNLSYLVRKILVGKDGNFKTKRITNIKDIEYKLNSTVLLILNADKANNNDNW